MTKSRCAAKALFPLPSFLLASAWDAGNAAMRKAGRTKWSRADYNAAAATQDRLTRACWGNKADADKNLCFIRFQIAREMERRGDLDMSSDLNETHRLIDDALAAQFAAA